MKRVTGLSFICDDGSDMGCCQNKANTSLKPSLLKGWRTFYGMVCVFSTPIRAHGSVPRKKDDPCQKTTPSSAKNCKTPSL